MNYDFCSQFVEYLEQKPCIIEVWGRQKGDGAAPSKQSKQDKVFSVPQPCCHLDIHLQLSSRI